MLPQTGLVSERCWVAFLNSSECTRWPRGVDLRVLNLLFDRHRLGMKWLHESEINQPDSGLK